MKKGDIGARVEHVCNYIIAGIEAEQLRTLYYELRSARARARAFEKLVKRALNKYE